MVNVKEQTALDWVKSEAHELSFVVELKLNNFGSGTWEDEDWVAGDYEVSGIGSSYTQGSPALYFSDGYVLNGPSGMYRAAAGSLVYVSKINMPFDDIPYPNFGGFQFICDAKDPIDNIYSRRWQSGQFKLFVGGILNKGIGGEVELGFDDYKVLMSGSTKDAKWGVRSVSPTLAPEKDLDIAFPPNKFKGTGGAEGGAWLRGKRKPFMLGSPFNVTPIFLGDGGYMYFDSTIARGLSPSNVEPTYVIPELKVRNDGEPLTASNLLPVSASNNQILSAVVPDGEFVYNESVFKVGGEVGQITIDGTGLWDTEISANSGEYKVECRNYLLTTIKRLVEELADVKVIIDEHVPKDEVLINSHVGNQILYGEQSGWFVAEKTTLRKFVSTLLTSAGYIILEQLDGSVLIKKRAPLHSFSQERVIPNKHIIFASQNDDGIATHVSSFNVMYRKNWTIQPANSMSSTNQTLYSFDGKWAERTNDAVGDLSSSDDSVDIESPFLWLGQAQALADTVLKYGAYSRKCSFEAKSEKWKHQAGDMVFAELDIYPKGARFELLEVEEHRNSGITKFGAIAYV